MTIEITISNSNTPPTTVITLNTNSKIVSKDAMKKLNAEIAKVLKTLKEAQ